MASKVYFADLRTDVHENLQQKLTRTMSEKRNVKNTGSYHKDNRLYFLRSIFNFIQVNLL